MIFIYIQYIELGAKTKIPFRLVLYSEDSNLDYKVFNIRPEITIPRRTYLLNDLDRLEVLSSEAFCNSADELIDLFKDQNLIFSEKIQFDLLKSQFRSIGYNFNLKPTILWLSQKKSIKNLEQSIELVSEQAIPNSIEFAKIFLKLMYNFKNENSTQLEDYKSSYLKPESLNLSKYNRTPGVYFFLNELGKVIYVGKAKNIRKRLQSHFSNSTIKSNIDYSEVVDIDVVYTGNDIISQLIESTNIKSLKPSYNSQQIINPDPFIINLSTTSKGIARIKITRKEFEDSLPKKYFNRKSVIEALAKFCNEYNLCRKHCGLETVKGPCSNYTKKAKTCVCSSGESIENYNKRFQDAFYKFRSEKTRRIYKLKGRNKNEDAFIYELNGIYEGYGYIEKSSEILNFNDILGNLIRQTNNYDTARILQLLNKILKNENIINLKPH